MTFETPITTAAAADVPERIWLHRISHEAEVAHPLLDRGILTIGFSEFAKRDFLEALSGSSGWEIFEREFLEQWGNRPRSRHHLWLFLVNMQPGDWVVVPSWGVFSLYRITGPARVVGDLSVEGLATWNGRSVELQEGQLQRILSMGEESSDAYDLGFYREVEPVVTGIPRGDFADAALTSRMKFRGTNINCSDLRESLVAALDGFSRNRPINLHEQILEAGQEQVCKLLQQQLNPDKLEALIRWYFQSLGASDVSNPAKNESGKDGDGDIVAIFEPLRTIYYVQAKHHAGNTDHWAIEQITAYTDQKSATSTNDGYTHIPWVVSTAEGFSDEAVRLAAQHGVLLVNGPELARMILETGISGLDTAFG